MTKPIVVMALDISRYRTGYAIGSMSMPAPKFNTWEPLNKGLWKKIMGDHLLEWELWLEARIAEFNVDYLAMESLTVPPKEFNYEGHVPMAQMHGVAVKTAKKLNIRCGEVAISTWRLHWIGAGFAPKDTPHADRTPWLKKASVAAALKRNWYVEYDDEAEALGVMDYALTCLDNDYAHRWGPDERRKEQRADRAAYFGDSLI